jgi:hypothetical protein
MPPSRRCFWSTKRRPKWQETTGGMRTGFIARTIGGDAQEIAPKVPVVIVKAARRRQQDQRGRGPRNYTRSGDRIREDVNDRLTDDWRVDASDIEVTVSGTEVTLTGTVSTREQRRRAKDITENISGVTHVQNNLRVKQLEKSWSGAGIGSSQRADNLSSSTGSAGSVGSAASATGTTTTNEL